LFASILSSTPFAQVPLLCPSFVHGAQLCLEQFLDRTMIHEFTNSFLVSALGDYISWSMPKESQGMLYQHMKSHIDAALLNMFRCVETGLDDQTCASRVLL
jgi:hypothetical protein